MVGFRFNQSLGSKNTKVSALKKLFVALLNPHCFVSFTLDACSEVLHSLVCHNCRLYTALLDIWLDMKCRN